MKRVRDVIRILERHGFVLVRQRGSHRLFRNAAGRRVTVAGAPGRELPPGTLGAIRRQSGLSRNLFR